MREVADYDRVIRDYKLFLARRRAAVCRRWLSGESKASITRSLGLGPGVVARILVSVSGRKKNMARLRVYDATSRGRLIRPSVCSRCGEGCRPEGHHKDYSRPLDVEWLCPPCHRREHRDAKMARKAGE